MDRTLGEAQADLDRLLDTARSLMLASVDGSGRPEASYAPFIRDEAGRLYVFVSTLSRHTANLAAARPLSVLIIQDEQDSGQIYARLRVTYYCAVQTVGQDEREWPALLQRFQARFGEVIEVLRSLTDFTLFRITPLEGQFVRGFGEAYRLVEGRLEHIRPAKS